MARQSRGPAGRVENCQIGVFLGYASSRARAGIDRALYLPREWTADLEWRSAADVPETAAFQTKLSLAREMVKRALNAGVPAHWIVVDAVDSSDGKLRPRRSG